MSHPSTHFIPTEKERLHYGPHWQEHMLRQYELYVVQLDTISTMRQKTNEFFLTLQTAFLGAVGYMLTTVPAMYHVLFLLVVGGVGLLECYFWYSMLYSYKTLKDAKFTLLHEWESMLPVPVFKHELELMKKHGTYIPLTKKELYIPLFFGLLYLSLALFGCYLWLK